jgi:hypothetical protein
MGGGANGDGDGPGDCARATETAANEAIHDEHTIHLTTVIRIRFTIRNHPETGGAVSPAPTENLRTAASSALRGEHFTARATRRMTRCGTLSRQRGRPSRQPAIARMQNAVPHPDRSRAGDPTEICKMQRRRNEAEKGGGR